MFINHKASAVNADRTLADFFFSVTAAMTRDTDVGAPDPTLGHLGAVPLSEVDDEARAKLAELVVIHLLATLGMDKSSSIATAVNILTGITSSLGLHVSAVPLAGITVSSSLESSLENLNDLIDLSRINYERAHKQAQLAGKGDKTPATSTEEDEIVRNLIDSVEDDDVVN